MPTWRTEGPWAKLAYDENRNVTAALPLADHSFDVAAAMAALLAGGAWARALERTAGRCLTEQDHARLTALAALHDIGKANSGFQARRNPRADRVGHEGQVAALLLHSQLSASGAGLALKELCREWGLWQHLAALMAHHGKLRDEFRYVDQPRREPGLNHVCHWLPKDGYDPAAEAWRLIKEVRARWPLAWEPGPKLPETPRFVALFAGLVTLADWLGSDGRRFPVEGPYGDEREAIRGEQAKDAIAARGLAPLATCPVDFATAFGLPAPRGVQTEASADDLGAIALIEAETGSGKTEAALWRWLALRRAGKVDGLYFALPTRSAAVQLHGRVNAMLQRVWGQNTPEAVLAVPGYLQAGDATGQTLPGYEVRWDDGGSDARWAAERSNRYLAARVAVGTIDQALLGVLPIKHVALRAAALARSLLVVDEVHSSDAYMSGLLQRLLGNHTAAGGQALLLSATLGGATRARLLGQPRPSLEEALAQPYPALSGTDAQPRAACAESSASKQVRIEIAVVMGQPASIARLAVDAARQGASVLVVRNSVAGAIAVAQEVEALAPESAFRVKGVATLHHGRFAASDRKLLDAEVECAFGKHRTNRGRVLVGTQTLEQSLDIDADLLIADLAPMDVLLQRIGRLHRHPGRDRGTFAEARVVVLRPAERDLTTLLDPTRERYGLGPLSRGRGVYPDLRQLEATLRQLEDNPTVTIPRDNRQLVEGALHPAVLASIADRLDTAWKNHAAQQETRTFADADTAARQALDLATPFRKWVFPVDAEAIATRLGARDWLIDFDPPFAGPFGCEVARLAIPHWLAGQIGSKETPELLGAEEHGRRFSLGGRTYLYGRWGLSEDRSS